MRFAFALPSSISLIVKAAAAPDVRDALMPLGYDVAPGSPE